MYINTYYSSTLTASNYIYMYMYAFSNVSAELNACRPHYGQQVVAGRMRALLDSSVHPSELRSRLTTHTGLWI